MKQSVGLPTKVIACALAVLLGLSGVYVPDVAWAEEQPAVPEWAVDDGETQDDLSAQATLPAAYDMRSDGLVTPVKFQNPWGSCWAFGAIAAAELSINTRYDTQVDLSERHLVWFGRTPIDLVDDPAQIGEGINVVGGEEFRSNRNHKYNSGGFTIQSSPSL